MSPKRANESKKWIPSSWEWHFAGEKSLWWRFYPARAISDIDKTPSSFYHRCKNVGKDMSEGIENCCELYSLSPSLRTFSWPLCCTDDSGGAVDSSVSKTCCSSDNTCNRMDCPCDKVAIFDLDGTLIRTKSGRTFPVDCHDWRLHNERVPSYLKRLHSLGYRLVIISNQLGIDRGNCTLGELTKKVDMIQAHLSLPLVVCLCAKDDIFRKPRPGSAALVFGTLLPLLKSYEKRRSQFELSHARGKYGDCTAPMHQIGMSRSKEFSYPKVFFVGDAAGRPQDHSSADRHFANNIGIPFFTPEEFFDIQIKAGTKVPTRKRLSNPFDPKMLILCGERNAEKYKEQQLRPPPGIELVILVGAPGSGKSTWASRMLPFHSPVRQDDLKTTAKCISMCMQLLKDGKNVVVDMQNKDEATRKVYIKIAREFSAKCSVKCVAFLWPKEVCMHFNEFRSLVANARRVSPEIQPVESTAGDHTRFRLNKVPNMVISMFYAKLEIPTKDEGFDEVKILQDVEKDFVLLDTYLTEDERNLLGSYLN